MNGRVRLGVDIGGTFTDATLMDVRTGQVTIEKVLSTPEDPSIGFIEATCRILAKSGTDPSVLDAIVHATTVATNAIIETNVARAAFVTTEGFRDMLELARQMRPSLYDLRFEKPRPIVERRHCYGVRERLGSRGEVVIPLDVESVRAVGEQIRRAEIDAVAICFLHSYLNPEHERLAGEILSDELPGVTICLSVDVAPEIREYYRASTTVINAAIAPIVASYLSRIEAGLESENLPSDLLIMQSSGGVYSAHAARESPVHMVESGPAAGVIAATQLAANVGHRNVLSLDMGGTTAKACLVRDGEPRITKEFEVGATAAPGSGSSRGSGYPIRTPVIDLVEIGSGGGSIAWIDDGGALRVGPRSAGADPGPACYARGGDRPTVTDANLVLGRLNPAYFLGGSVKLDADAARRAIETCAAEIGLDVVETAHSIVEIANTAMISALKLVSLQRGYDPRDFLFVAFGGAGPVHANRLAIELEIPKTLIPMSAGIASSMGLLMTDLRREHSMPVMRLVETVTVEELGSWFAELEERGRAELRKDGIGDRDMTFLWKADMRYAGQSYELTIPTESADLEGAGIAGLVRRFDDDHERAYGHSAPGEPIELVNLRVGSVGAMEKARGREVANEQADAQVSEREVYFAEAGGFVLCPVFDRYRLAAEIRIDGPAIVEEFDTSTVIHPHFACRVDSVGNLFLSENRGEQ